MNTVFINFYSRTREAVYRTLRTVDAGLGRRGGLMVLCYHSLAGDGWRFSTALHEFKLQMRQLLLSHQPVSLPELEDHIIKRKRIDKPSFLVTFDDGYRSVWDAPDFLRTSGIRPALFALAKRRSVSREKLGTRERFLGTGQMKQLMREGWTIGSHSCTHRDLDSLRGIELAFEIGHSKKQLEQELQAPVRHFAYPRGRYSPETVKHVKQSGFVLGLSMDDGGIMPGGDPYRIPRIGVDATHSLREFSALYSPSNIAMRGVIKKTFLKNYL